MTHNLKYEFVVDEENKSITVKREFAAKRELVWDAYTKSEILDKWWAPHPWKAKTKSMDFSVGGRWLYAMVGPGGGEEQWSVEQYLQINPKTQFTALDAFTNAHGEVNKEMPQAKWDVTFADHANHTMVQIVLSFSDVAQLKAIIKTGFKEGLAMGMENLDALLTGKQH